MKHRVTIQGPAKVSDDQGGFTESWEDGADVWASIEPLKGYEKFQAQQMQAPVTHRIVMRYRTDVTTASRLKHRDRVFWVKEVINRSEENRFLIIKAIERSQP